ncbi:hypothetical protein L9F63_021597, partial [Diploptera punctata]
VMLRSLANHRMELTLTSRNMFKKKSTLILRLEYLNCIRLAFRLFFPKLELAFSVNRLASA